MPIEEDKKKILMRFEMNDDFKAAISDKRCDFHCSDKYKNILLEIFWHDFSEQVYPNHWLLSFREDLEAEFEWEWFDRFLRKFRSKGTVPEIWQRNGITIDNKVSLPQKLSCLQRTISSVAFTNKKLEGYISILKDLDYKIPYLVSGDSDFYYSEELNARTNPTLRDDILTKGLSACPPYYPYDNTHIRFKNAHR